MTNLDKIKAAAEAATEEPWGESKYVTLGHEKSRQVFGNDGEHLAMFLKKEDSEFAALARTAVPALCEALGVAKVELRKIHEEMAGKDCPEYYEAEARIDKLLEGVG